MGLLSLPRPQSATTLSNGDNRWTNLPALVAGTGEATCNNETKNNTFDTLNATNYLTGEAFKSNTNPVVTGIQFDVSRRRGTGRSDAVTDNVVRVLLGGSEIGTNKASTVEWPTGLGNTSYGSNGDLWGLTQSQADSIFVLTAPHGRIVSDGFGLALRPQGRNTGFVSAISLTIYYQVNGIAGRVTGQWVSANPRVSTLNSWQDKPVWVRSNGFWVLAKG